LQPAYHSHATLHGRGLLIVLHPLCAPCHSCLLQHVRIVTDCPCLKTPSYQEPAPLLLLLSLGCCHCSNGRDPRFDQVLLPAKPGDKEAAAKRYSFLYDDVLPQEKATLKQRLKVGERGGSCASGGFKRLMFRQHSIALPVQHRSSGSRWGAERTWPGSSTQGMHSCNTGRQDASSCWGMTVHTEHCSGCALEPVTLEP
jgi:hypothetical protein